MTLCFVHSTLNWRNLILVGFSREIDGKMNPTTAHCMQTGLEKISREINAYV